MSRRVASIGECMVELRERPDGTLTRGHGGDTLNTAVYLARLGVAVDYVTALGDDAWSEDMVTHWREEGIGTGLVQRLPGLLPGLYIIQIDPAGERRFSYWRDSAAARRLFDRADVAGPRRDSGGLRHPLSVGHHPLDLQRGRPRASVRGARACAGPGRPGGVRHEFPPARLAGPGAGEGAVPPGLRAGRYRARLHRGSGAAVRGRGRDGAIPVPCRRRAGAETGVSSHACSL